MVNSPDIQLGLTACAFLLCSSMLSYIFSVKSYHNWYKLGLKENRRPDNPLSPSLKGFQVWLQCLIRFPSPDFHLNRRPSGHLPSPRAEPEKGFAGRDGRLCFGSSFHCWCHKKSLSTFSCISVSWSLPADGTRGSMESRQWKKQSVVPQPPPQVDSILAQEVFPSASVGPLWE